MTRFMRFWLRLGVVLAIPLVALAWWVVEAQSVSDPGFTAFVWVGTATLLAAYLGIGWALNAFFR